MDSSSSAPASRACAACCANHRSSQMVSAMRRPPTPITQAAFPGGEVALLVEDVVVGQALLAVERFGAPAAQDRCRVVARAAIAMGMSDHDADLGGVRGQGEKLVLALVAEIVAEKQVLGGISR